MAINFYDIFSPCVLLYPFSPTLASTSARNVHQWLIYRLYILLCYAAVVGTLVSQVYINVFVNNMPWTVMNKPSFLTLQCIYFTVLLVKSMIGAKKNKIQRLMNEINANIADDDMDNSVNDRKYKMYNAVFIVALLFNHITVSIVNIMNTEGALSFLLPLTFISLLLDSEILVITSFVSIFNVKMGHFVSKLESIVKNKEASKEELYERYRHGLYVLKKMNTIWQGRIFVVIIFQLYFMTRTVMRIFAKKQLLNDVMSVLTVICKCTMTVRHLFIYAQLGLLGQWMAERFDQISQLANTINDLDLGDELNHQTTKMSRLGAVCPGRIRAGSLVVDGQLPLQAVSALISTVILMLQFGLTAY